MSGRQPLLELRRRPVREHLLNALAELDANLPDQVPVLIGSWERAGCDFCSVDPGRPDRVVAEVAAARPEEIDRAVATVIAAQPDWADRQVGERAQLLQRAAELLERWRQTLIGLCVRECAMPFGEADQEVCRAIDALCFYADQAEKLERDLRPIGSIGERRVLRYRPRGAVGVIGSWQSPIAAPAGMCAAALLCGNGVILKPAEQASTCAFWLVQALSLAGVPAQVLCLLPGGEAVGQALACHPEVSAVAFSGSRAAGADVLRRAVLPQRGRGQFKQVTLHLGGKSCVMVDAGADLDHAIPRILASAFSYAGQHPHAASLVLAHRRCYRKLSKRLAGAVSCLRVGAADRFETQVPPLIHRQAQQHALAHQREATGKGRVLAQAACPDTTGFFASPTLVDNLPEDLSPAVSERCGPLLHLVAVDDLDEAAERISRLPHLQVVSVFTRNPAAGDRLAARLATTELYINHTYTPALTAHTSPGALKPLAFPNPCVPDGLSAFTESQLVCENTIRHGLVF